MADDGRRPPASTGTPADSDTGTDTEACSSAGAPPSASVSVGRESFTGCLFSSTAGVAAGAGRIVRRLSCPFSAGPRDATPLAAEAAMSGDRSGGTNGPVVGIAAGRVSATVDGGSGVAVSMMKRISVQAEPGGRLLVTGMANRAACMIPDVRKAIPSCTEGLPHQDESIFPPSCLAGSVPAFSAAAVPNEKATSPPGPLHTATAGVRGPIDLGFSDLPPGRRSGWPFSNPSSMRLRDAYDFILFYFLWQTGVKRRDEAIDGCEITANPTRLRNWQ